MIRPTAGQNLGLYAEGWTEGDLGKILAAIHVNFVFYDSREGPIPREEFSEYFNKFKASNKPFSPQKFMDLSGVAVREALGHTLAAVFWRTGTLQGTGLVIAGTQGVVSETVETVKLDDLSV